MVLLGLRDASTTVFELIGGVDGARGGVLAGHPVVEVEQTTAVGAERESRDVDVGEEGFAHGATEDGAVVAERLVGRRRRRMGKGRHGE